uniref:Uncharacterized protein n=1 Tax=Anguilla anguilla TaxID=7936 RepID=A0A0E9X5H4_ANGAN
MNIFAELHCKPAHSKSLFIKQFSSYRGKHVSPSLSLLYWNKAQERNAAFSSQSLPQSLGRIDYKWEHYKGSIGCKKTRRTP